MLTDRRSDGSLTRLRMVPVGRLSRLPLIAGVEAGGESAAVSVCGSGQLHRMAAGSAIAIDQADVTPRIVAVTNPQPCDWDGVRWPPLPGATEEGLMLSQDFGAAHFTGKDATAATVIRAFEDSGVNVLHIAAHGVVSETQDFIARILLANDAGGRATTVTEQDLPSHLAGKVVFLAACWTGSTQLALPDETAGFAPWLLQAGASAVIAPLWPIDDQAALQFTGTFYRALKTARSDVAVAAAKAAAGLREWATGSGRANAQQRDAAVVTANAFVVSGG